MTKIGSHRGKKHRAQFVQQRCTDTGCIAAGLQRAVDCRQRLSGVAIDERLEECLEVFAPLRSTNCGNDLVERRQRVSSRSPTGPDHVLAILGCDLDPGVAYDMVNEVADLTRREQRELKVLRATSDGRHNLVRLCRTQHKNNVWRRFLEGLQQCVLGARRQHVDLIEDVHLGAPRRSKSHFADQVAHGIDAIVRCGIEFMQVVTAASLEGQTRITFVTRLTTLQIRTVQRLGQDAGRRGLTRTPGPAKEIRMADAITFDGVSQRGYDMVLPKECILESGGSVTPIQRLIGHCLKA